jgi:hypothetical protein
MDIGLETAQRTAVMDTAANHALNTHIVRLVEIAHASDTAIETVMTEETTAGEVEIGTTEAGEMIPVIGGGEGMTRLTPGAPPDGMIAETVYRQRVLV